MFTTNARGHHQHQPNVGRTLVCGFFCLPAINSTLVCAGGMRLACRVAVGPTIGVRVAQIAPSCGMFLLSFHFTSALGHFFLHRGPPCRIACFFDRFLNCHSYFCTAPHLMFFSPELLIAMRSIYVCCQSNHRYLLCFWMNLMTVM